MFQASVGAGFGLGMFCIKTRKGIAVEVRFSNAFGSDKARIEITNASDIPAVSEQGADILLYQTVDDLIEILNWANDDARTGYEMTHPF